MPKTKDEKPSCFGKQDNLSATPEKCNACTFNDECYAKTLDNLYYYRDVGDICTTNTKR